MLKQMLDEILRRPLDALTATMDMLGKNVPAGMTVDGMISRAAHALFRPQQDDAKADGRHEDGNSVASGSTRD